VSERKCKHVLIQFFNSSVVKRFVVHAVVCHTRTRKGILAQNDTTHADVTVVHCVETVPRKICDYKV